MNNIFIHDQLSFMATINTSSVWSTLIIAMNRWEFMHVWMIIVHICMNSHLFISMINVDQADDMLIVAMKDWWSFMITYIIMSSWNISWPLLWIEGFTWPSDIRMFGDVAAHFSIFLGTWQVLLGRGGNCQMSSVVSVGYVDHEPSWFVVTITGLLEDR